MSYQNHLENRRPASATKEYVTLIYVKDRLPRKIHTMPTLCRSGRPVMSSGANLGKTVTQSAMRWWRATRGQARGEQPLVSNRRLADAVLSRADPVSARAQVHHDVLRMMRYFSVDPGQVPSRFSAALRDAEQLCAHCMVVGRCQHWFHGRSDDAPRSFCPNAELYQEIAVSQRQASDSDEPPTA